jgi:hypothetical protein
MQATIDKMQESLEKMGQMDVMMSGLGMVGNNAICFYKAYKLWYKLSRKTNLRNTGIEFASPPETWSFRFYFPKGKRVFGLSIAIPIDACGNLGDSASGYPETIEIALINNSGSLVYNEDLGYEDICRFNSDEEVESEILRLLAF